jgi:hypothetical protein
MNLKLSDLAGDDAKERIASTLADSRKKVADISEFYESLTGNKVPDSVKDYANGEWKNLLSDSAREVLEFYEPEQQKVDRKRVLRASDAVKVLESYEDEVARVAVTDPRALLFSGKQRTIKMVEFGATHWGVFSIEIVDGIQLFAKLLAEAVKFKAWDLLNPWKVLTLQFKVVQLALSYLPQLVVVAASGFAAVGVAGFLEAFTSIWSKANYKANLKEINAQRRIAESIARSKALPQRKGRVRRRKRSRR